MILIMIFKVIEKEANRKVKFTRMTENNPTTNIRIFRLTLVYVYALVCNSTSYVLQCSFFFRIKLVFLIKSLPR